MSRKKLLAFTIILFVFLGIFLSLRRITGGGLRPVTAKEGDYLVYAVSPSHSSNSQFMLYDPAKNTHVPILSDWNVHELSISTNGRLAFSSLHEETRALYLLDYPFINSIPIKITDGSTIGFYPKAWSPDGRYLAFASRPDNIVTLSIWNGESSTEIFQSSSSISEITWSPDGRLAFTVFYTPDGDESEIYIWDGDETVSLTQNPTGEDRYPVWNEDGHLAFLSERAGVYDIFIWDGISTTNDVPDVNSYSNLATPLIGHDSKPVWSNSGSLTFIGPRQIYEWDGKDATNISQNPGFNNYDQHWRGDGYWSFHTSSSGGHLIYIRDENNKTRLIREGYGVRWSESGYFIFCERNVIESHWEFSKVGLPRLVKSYGGWTLLLGNGRKIIEIAQGAEIEAVWANGERVVCSSG